MSEAILKTGDRWLTPITACSVLIAGLIPTGCSSAPSDEHTQTESKLRLGAEAMVYNQGWRVDQHLRFVTDVNNDSHADLVGFGSQGVFFAVADTGGDGWMDEPVVADLGNNQGWTLSGTVRTLADVNGDGRLDVVGFGPDVVKVAVKDDSAFGSFGGVETWSNEFTAAEGWTANHARLLGDVNGDGRADIVGIDDWGVYVSKAGYDTAGNDAFEPPMALWVRAFSQSLGWDSAKHIRLLADMDGDRLADIVGFGDDGVFVSKSNGKRFTAAEKVSPAFGYDAGWRIGAHVRAIANLNGDRYVDLIGLGADGAQVALGNATGFDPPQLWSAQLGDSDGWIAPQHVRLIGDVDADGRDDVVGIKDDHVYIAHNNGSGFDQLTVASDEFTTVKGWDAAKHPRLLADVDGNRQLDLLGFFNDAVYWDRLTPEPSLPADWTTPTCAASRLAPPAPGFCEGPWRYTKSNRVVSQHPSCQKVCSANVSCAKWENGITTTPSTISTSIVGTGTRTCAQFCNALGCANPTCSGTMYQPTVACQNDASARLSMIRSSVIDDIAAETNFDSAADQNQRSTQAQNAAMVTPSYFISKFNITVQPGPGGTVNRWTEQWRCQQTISKPNPVVAANEACGCNTFVDGTCEHDTGTPSTLFTMPLQLRPTGPGIANQECMTYDDLPTATAAQVQAKFEKLWAAQTIAPTTVTSDQFRRALVNRLKLVYELFGEQLQNQTTSTDQLHRAIALYSASPDINPTCALVDAPAVPAGCTTMSVGATRGELIRCQRLADVHASEGVASLAMTECAALLNGYLDLKASADDGTCGGPHLRDIGAKTVFKLVDKQLGLIASAPAVLGALPRQLYLLDNWYTVSKRAEGLGVFAAADQQRRDTSYLLGRFWGHVREKSGADAMLAELSASSTPDDAEQALGLSAVASRQSEQAVVKALFTVPGVIVPENVTLTRPPLRGLPLLALVGDALKPLVDDLDGLAVYHDIACQFRDCRAPATNTPSRNAWKILAALEEPTLGTKVSANPFVLGGWKTVFGTIASQQTVLTRAISDAVSASGGLAAANVEGDVHPLARQLWLLHKHARSFHDHYEATGLFDSTAQNRLQGSLLEQSQATVVNALRARANALGNTVDQYRNGLIAALQAQVAVMTSGAQLADLTNQRLHKATSMTQKAANLEGLRASGEDEARAFGSLTASFADVQAALDQGAFVQFGDTVSFELDGQAGRFTGGAPSPGSIAANTIPGLTAGEMLIVQTSGSWSPTCSISTMSWLRGNGGDPVPTNLSDAVIGPEGYTLSISDSGVAAYSSDHSIGVLHSTGVSYQYCQTSGAFANVVGVEAKACVQTSVTETNSGSVNWSTRTESRNSAAFATGLRLDNTPFPDAPVGSLLVVLVDPGTGAIRDVRLVQSGATTILIEGATTAHFVVNDKQCGTASTVNKLSVTVRPMLSAAAVADKALAAMGDVLGLLRQQQQTLAAQGTMLPNQATLLRQQAAQMLQARLGEISAVELPPPLASLFEAFVSHEIVATERRIEIATVQRSLDLDLIELRMIDDELKAGADRARLQRLVPQWLLRDLDHDHLRVSLVDLLSVSRDYLKPILELWYPHALDSVSFGPEINTLLNADIGTSLVSLAASGQTFVNSLLNAYENASFGAKPNAPQLPVVVLTFPRPGFEPTNTFWREADAARAQRVWDAIDDHTVAHFEITPEDFYSAHGGDAVLSCNEVVPLIKTMAFYVVRPGADSSNQVLNSVGRTFQGFGGANQSFVTVEGPKVYQLADATSGAPSAWQNFNLPVRYGESEATLTTFLNTPRQTRPVGLSAAGAFDIDFSVLDALPQQAGLGPDDPAPATEVQLVLEIDSRASSALPTWVSRCN